MNKHQLVKESSWKAYHVCLSTQAATLLQNVCITAKGCGLAGFRVALRNTETLHKRGTRMRIMWGARVGRLMGPSEMVGELIVCLSPMRYGRDAAADDSRQPLTSELGTRREQESGFTDNLLLRGALLGMERLLHLLRALDSQTLHYFA